MFDLLSRADRLNYLLFLLGAALLFIGIRLILIDSYGVQTPYWDDWGMGAFLTQSVTSGVGVSDFFKDANEHRLVFNRVLSLGLFKINHDQWDPLVSMVANSVIWTAIGVFFVRLVLRNTDQINTTALLVLIVAAFSLPLSLVNILWGIQTHTYTMILFSVLGCWYSNYRPYSLKWGVGIVSLFAASLTLAGGTFAAFAVVAVKGLCIVVDWQQRQKHLKTLIAALLAGLFGLSMILIQSGDNGAPQGLTFSEATTSFLKAMSWPNSTWIWPAFISILPILALAIQIIRSRFTPSKLDQFTLSLFAFVTAVSLAIAYARGGGGEGPARRYFEFMALLPIACAMAYMLIIRPSKPLIRQCIGLVGVALFALIIIAVPWHAKIVEFTLEERSMLKPIQERLVRNYLNTKDQSIFENKLYRHVPYPAPTLLINMLSEMDKADTLPHLLQTPKPMRWSPTFTGADKKASAFVKNGTFFASKGLFGSKRVGEDVFGSYKPRAGGMQATGRFESLEFRLNRPFAAIPVLGYLGYEGLTMKMVDVGSGEEFEIIPKEINSGYAEKWRTLIVPVPRGYYRLVAEDNNPKLWFAFATPRSIGRVSYYTQKLLENSGWVFRIGVLLLLLSLRAFFTTLLKRPNEGALRLS